MSGSHYYHAGKTFSLQELERGRGGSAGIVVAGMGNYKTENLTVGQIEIGGLLNEGLDPLVQFGRVSGVKRAPYHRAKSRVLLDELDRGGSSFPEGEPDQDNQKKNSQPDETINQFLPWLHFFSLVLRFAIKVMYF
jgi:hypothetical protein